MTPRPFTAQQVCGPQGQQDEQGMTVCGNNEIIDNEL